MLKVIYIKNMDRILPKKTWTSKRILLLSLIIGVISLIGAAFYLTSGKTKLNVDLDRITISEVTKGAFQENIPVNGVVLPIKTIYLDAIEGGRVEEKLVEDGSVMKAGQPILRLSNTDLELNLLSQQSSVYNTLTQMQIARNSAEQNTVTKLNQMTDVESQLREAERVYTLDKALLDQKVIAVQEFKKAENDYTYYSQKKKLTELLLRKDSITNLKQLDQAKQSYQGSQMALTLFKRKVGDLIVRAPVDGQLTSLEAEIGQSKNKGERLGQIDVLSGFKVQVDIDEHYISRIYTGLKGAFTLGEKEFTLKIKKIYTQVKGGRFQVDMEFTEKIPTDIRRGQNLQIRLALSDETTAILVPKGGFYQQTGGNWIFKLKEDGSLAYKVDIGLGRQNSEYYEVLQGIKPGDKVITSSYENFGTIQELTLKNK